MQVTETKSDGLKREYAITVTASALEAKTTEKLEALRKDFHMKGFRKGKAPLTLMKRQFGKSVLGEVVQETVEETVSKHLEDQGHRPAAQPDVKITNEEFDEGQDLNVELAYECLPDVPEMDFASISLERKTVAVSDADIDEALGRLAESSGDFEDRAEGEEAASGDQVVIDFLGKIDDEPFDGGEAEDYPLVLGSNSFIPGFEDQLTGAKTGETRAVNVSFPEDYGAANLAGKDAVFDVTVKAVKVSKPGEINDELAEKYGAENLEDLRSKLSEQIAAEYTEAGRGLIKRRLLDLLDERIEFELPQIMVDLEAKSIAHQLWHEENPNVEGHDHPEIEPDEEHQTLARRRVGLGLLLAEIGRKEEIEVTDAEFGQAIMSRARQFPGQEREFFDFVRQNREMQEQIRAPLYEDKVVDMILERADVTDVPVSKSDLEAEIEALEAEIEAQEAAS